jgi:hypothetical protein
VPCSNTALGHIILENAGRTRAAARKKRLAGARAGGKVKRVKKKRAAR